VHYALIELFFFWSYLRATATWTTLLATTTTTALRTALFLLWLLSLRSWGLYCILSHN
jgi:hypothetical protein